MDASTSLIFESQASSSQPLDLITRRHAKDLDHVFVTAWVRGRPKNTARAYLSEWKKLEQLLGDKTLSELTLPALQDYLSQNIHQAQDTRARAQAIIQSLFTFGVKSGYLKANLGVFLQRVPRKDTLNERILSKQEVDTLLEASAPRVKTILELLYISGIRVGELCSLKSKDLALRSNGAIQLTIFGKGGKTRIILLPPALSSQILQLTRLTKGEDPIFRSSQEPFGPLNPSTVFRMIKEAARQARIYKPVSPHWLRHAHATHSLSNGCPLHILQNSLGHASLNTTSRYLHAQPEETSASFLGK